MINRYDDSCENLRIVVSRALEDYSEDDLLTMLIDKNKLLRISAAKQLHLSGTNKTFDFIKNLISHSRFEMREIAAFTLGQLGTPTCKFAEESLKELVKILEDPYYEVQCAAIEAIGSLGMLGEEIPDVIVDKIIEKSKDENVEVRQSVAFALGMMRNSSSYECLSQLMIDNNKEVRENAEFSISLFPD